MPQYVRPEDSQSPVAPLHVIQEKGLDPRTVKSCAVAKSGEVLGCPHAARCALRGFGRAENMGFGPKSSMPGEGGEGPKYVGVYWQDAFTGMERMDEVACYSFMASFFKRYAQQDATGDKVIILGGPGTKLVKRRIVPVDPNNNASKNYATKEVVEEVTVSEYPSLDVQSPSLEYAEKMREIRIRMARQQALLEEQAAEGVAGAEPTGGRRGKSDRNG